MFNDNCSGSRADSVDARGGTAEANHRNTQGYARPTRGAHAGLPQHRHQGDDSSDFSADEI